MEKKSQETWRCLNPQCQREVLLETIAETWKENRRCTCGGILKKKDKRPFLSYLQFLRIEEPESIPPGSHND